MKLKNIKIDNVAIGYNQPPFIVAEAGVNHNNSLKIAIKLIDEAKKAGAHAIKFQTFKAEQVVTAKGEMAKYQIKNLQKKETQFKMLKKIELKDEHHYKIIKYCKRKKIIFLSTPHGGFQALKFLIKLKLPAIKFGSGDLTNLPLLETAAKTNKPLIIGTGMATMDEVQAAIKIIKKLGNDKIIMLHCTTNYPCPIEEVNLSSMVKMKNKLPVLVGYSDHTLGEQVPIMAVTLGACVIEKHFTLDKQMKGPDHKASIEPKELKSMIDKINKTEIILGSSIKKPNASELIMIKTIRKSLVTTCDIKKGQIITKEMIDIKRPSTGLPPSYYKKILNKRSKANIKKDNLIKKHHVL